MGEARVGIAGHEQVIICNLHGLVRIFGEGEEEKSSTINIIEGGNYDHS